MKSARHAGLLLAGCLFLLNYCAGEPNGLRMAVTSDVSAADPSGSSTHDQQSTPIQPRAISPKEGGTPSIGDEPTEVTALDFTHSIIDDDPPASYRINELQLGDINGDGNTDIWITGRGSGSNAYQMVWYENPSWDRYEIAPGDYKYGALADFDLDGDIDIVAGRDDDNKVYWFENTGTPQQQDWPAYFLGLTGKPDLFHTGDINNDSRPDIIYKFKDRWGWLENPLNPANLWPVHDIWTGSTRTGGAVADIDQDSDLDILYGNGWFENPLPGGNPEEGAEWEMYLIDAGWPGEARGAVGDLNGDGHLDIVLTSEEGSQGVSWYRGPENPTTGSWEKFSVVSTGYQGVHSAEVADFDLDGDLDIFVAEMHTGSNPDKVTVFLNEDISQNEWQEVLVADFGSHNAKVGFIDGDNRPDIVGKNFQSGEIPLRVDLWLNSPAAPTVWNKHILDEDRPWRAVFITSGDIDGDTLPDVISGGWWYRNPGNIADPWSREAIGGDLNNMAVVADIDLDTDLDIIGTKGGPGNNVNSDDVLWAENDGTGEFTIHDNLPDAAGDFLQGAVAAQITPGGLPEVILSWHNETSTQIYAIPAPPQDPWIWDELSPTTTGEEVAPGDIDDDGDIDLHLGTIWLRNDGGNWATLNAFTFGDPLADPDRVKLADVDGDGDTDVVVGAEHARRVVWAEAPADPSDTWIEHVITTDSFGMSMDVADIDEDGDPDVVLGEHNTQDPNLGRVLLFLNEGNGQTWQEIEVDSGLEHHDGTQFVDIDKDGDLDVISIGWFHNNVVLYENQGTSPSGYSSKIFLSILVKMTHHSRS